MFDLLFDTIQRHSPLNDQDKALCEQYFHFFESPKQSILEKQDAKPHFLYFCIDGFLRLFYYSPQGEAITTHFTSAGGFIASFLDFIHEKPASNAIECLTDCKLLRIARTDLQALISQSERFKVFSLIIFEQAMSAYQSRANDLATLSAELHYKKILETKPEIIQHVPLQYVASYLGLAPESLSRIRRQIVK